MKARNPLNNKWYYFLDKCLPFGSSVSCAVFQKFSDSVAHIVMWLIRNQIKRSKKIINYLDDFFFAAFKHWLCNYQVEVFLHVCNLINFPVSLEKTVWSSTQITFLGFLLDTVKQVVGIPLEKLSKGRNMIHYVLSKKKITVKHLQKVCGFLNFISRCVIPGRAFTRRLYAHMANHKHRPYHHIKVNSEMRMDLEVWWEFLQEPEVYYRPFVEYNIRLSAQEIDFYMDASRNPKLGFGGKCEKSFMFSQWSYNFIKKYNPGIEYLELFALTAGVLAWGSRFASKQIILFTDNEGVKHMVNNTSAKGKNCMVLIRILVLFQMKHNMRIYAKHVPTKLNGVADSLSRLQFNRFDRLIKPESRDDHVTPIPQEIWPMEKIWQ